MCYVYTISFDQQLHVFDCQNHYLSYIYYLYYTPVVRLSSGRGPCHALYRFKGSTSSEAPPNQLFHKAYREALSNSYTPLSYLRSAPNYILNVPLIIHIII